MPARASAIRFNDCRRRRAACAAASELAGEFQGEFRETTGERRVKGRDFAKLAFDKVDTLLPRRIEATVTLMRLWRRA
jgi:hypothetical protein